MLMTLVMHLHVCSPCNRCTINFYDVDDDDDDGDDDDDDDHLDMNCH